MAIINTNPTPPTPQQQLASAVVAQQQQMQNLWQQIISVVTNTEQFIYNNPLPNGNGGTFSAQDVFNVYGTNGVDLCNLSDAVLGMIQGYTGSAPTIPPAGYTLTKNSDGTVTVTT